MENGSSLSYENLWKFQSPWTNENGSCCQAGYFKAIYTTELNLILNNITLLNKTPQGYSIQGGFFSFSKSACLFFNILYFLLKWKSLSRAQLFAPLWTVKCQAPLWNSPGKNTGMGSHCFLQGIFLTKDQPGSPALQADSLSSEPPDQFLLEYSQWSMCDSFRRTLKRLSHQEAFKNIYFSLLFQTV